MTPPRKALGAAFWKQQAGLGDQRLADDWRALLICPDDDAPLEYQPQGNFFSCAMCRRRYEENGQFLTLLPSNDPYQVTGGEAEALASEAATSPLAPTPAERFGGLWQKALAQCGELKGARVLDVCCGNGSAAVEFAKLGASVGAVDIVAGLGGLVSAAARAQEAGVTVSLFRADAVRLPLLSESFDVVHVSDAIHRLRRPERFLKEVGRLLKPSGVLVNLGEPIGAGGAGAFANTDPRRSGRALSMADYEGIYREGGLTLSFYFADEELPPTGLLSRAVRRFKAQQSTKERLLVGKIAPDFRLPKLRWRRAGNQDGQ